MSGEALLAVICGGALTMLLIVVAIGQVRARRRALRTQEPFPAQWRALLEATVPLYRRLPRDVRQRLEPLVRHFLEDVHFTGCGGLVVTDEMRLAIALQACLLTIRSGAGAYDELASVLVYPDQFVVDESDEDEAGVVTTGWRALSGQSFDTGRIVLSWRDVRESGDETGYNVVLHEFAHYLDHAVDGALSEPPERSAAHASWRAVLTREYEAHCAAVERDEDPLIDPYGAEAPEEFFAVATETFFERAREMAQQHPELYAGFKALYGLDPAAWAPAEPS